MRLTKKEYFGLGKVPIGIGAVLKGWDIQEKDFRDNLTLPVIDFRAMTSACLHDCYHCFTDKLKKTLTLGEITGVIDQLAEMKIKTIDFLGEGEPTLDKDFFKIIEYTKSKGIQPIIFTDAATKLRNRDFVRRIYNSGATIIPKCDSLFNPEYQHWIIGDKKGTYFNQRKEALNLLIEEGFNKIEPDGTTRLGFDMVVSKRNIDEVEKTLRYCRENNLWVVFTFFLPTGRSGREEFDKSLVLTIEDKQKLGEVIRRVDKEYGFNHEIYNNFLTSPCVEFLCIYGDGRVSPCVGNEDIVGNIKKESIKEISKKIIDKYPCHDPKTYDGNCLYRPKF